MLLAPFGRGEDSTRPGANLCSVLRLLANPPLDFGSLQIRVLRVNDAPAHGSPRDQECLTSILLNVIGWHRLEPRQPRHSHGNPNPSLPPIKTPLGSRPPLSLVGLC
jgi:hypothetical protein